MRFVDPKPRSVLATRFAVTCSTPYQMVKDLRSGVETSNVEAVLDDGDLDPFVIGYHRWATGNADAEDPSA